MKPVDDWTTLEDRLVEVTALLVRLTDVDSCKNSARGDAVIWLRQVGHKLLLDRADDIRALARRSHE